jgi:hypothetical protein
VVNGEIWENKLAVFRARGLILLNLNQGCCKKASSGKFNPTQHFLDDSGGTVSRWPNAIRIPTYSQRFVKQNVGIPNVNQTR